MSEKQSKKKQELTQQQSNKELSEPELVLEGEEDLRKAVALAVREFSGPIPPPESLAGYEKTLPGSADRILQMAEKQSQHRQELEKREVEIEARDSLLGIILAFILGIGSLGVAFTIIIVLPESSGALAAAVFGAAGFGSIITAFLKTTRKNNSSSTKQ